MIFEPYNKRIVIEKLKGEEKEPDMGVLLPDDFSKDDSRYEVVKFIKASFDCSSFVRNLNKGMPDYLCGDGTGQGECLKKIKCLDDTLLVVESSMIEEFKIKENTVFTIRENYIVGVSGEKNLE